jgi:hypothetical protein
MKLLTKAVEKKLGRHPLYSTDATPVEEKDVLVKFFNPTGSGTWFIFEGEKTEDGDWRFFGLCHIHEWELGYVLLSELAGYEGPFGLGIERDRHWHGKVNDGGERVAA